MEPNTQWPAVITALATITTLIVSQVFSACAARAQSNERQLQAREQRAFDADEHRYTARRDAVVGMLAAADNEIDRIRRFAREVGDEDVAPGDVHDDYLFPALFAAEAQVALIATPTVVSTAEDLRGSIVDCFCGKSDAWNRHTKAREAFLAAAREELAG